MPKSYGRDEPHPDSDPEEGGYVNGLGCPNCHATFHNMDNRTSHIRKRHPGEYSGPTADMLFMIDRIRGEEGGEDFERPSWKYTIHGADDAKWTVEDVTDEDDDY